MNPFVNYIKRKLKVLLLRALKPLVDDISICTYRVYGSKDRLCISPNSKVANSLFNTFSGNITVGDFAFTGHNVSFLTGTHDYLLVGKKRMNDIPTSGRDIIIREGAWIGSNAIILGPCEIGKNSVVAAGSIVVSDIPPSTLVGGCPAKVIKKIHHEEKH